MEPTDKKTKIEMKPNIQHFLKWKLKLQLQRKEKKNYQP